MRDGAVGGGHSRATNPSRARSASTPVIGVPAPYVWTSRRRRCVAVVLIGETSRSSELWSASSSPTRIYVGSSLLQRIFCCTCVSSGNDPWSLAYMRSLLNAVASVASPFPNNGTRAIMFSFWSGCAYRDMLLFRILQSIHIRCIDWCTAWDRYELIASRWLQIGSWSFSIARKTCPYRLESPSGLTVQTRRDWTDGSESCVAVFSDVPVAMVNVIDLVKIRDIMNDPESAWLDQSKENFIANL